MKIEIKMIDDRGPDTLQMFDGEVIEFDRGEYSLQREMIEKSVPVGEWREFEPGRKSVTVRLWEGGSGVAFNDLKLIRP